MAYALAGHTWDFIYTVFAAIDILVIGALLAARRSTFRRQAVWFIIMLINPVVMFGAYIMVGKPVFRRRFRVYRNEGIDLIDRAIMDRTSMAEPLSAARALARSGALGFSADSSAAYIPGGTQYFGSLFGDLRRAQSLIAIECYVIRRDRTGKEFLDILEERARAGVKVYISFDDYGYDGGDMLFVSRLKKSRCRISFFHNMNRMMFSPKKNCRDHRKTVVIDGRIAYQGGYNIGNEYLGDGPLGEWRDAAVRIRGPAADFYTRTVLQDWRYASREDMVCNESLYRGEKAGDVTVQLTCGGPDMPGTNSIHMQYVSIADACRRRIWITTPYLGPTEPLVYLLRLRALEGADVRIIIPDIGDHAFVYWGNRFSASRLMDAGVRVYEYHDGFIHAKTAVGDGCYCSVGSANMDPRSMNLNFECNAMVYSEEMAADMEKAFEKDLERCTPYTMEMYRRRNMVQRFKTFLSRFLADLL